MSRSAVASSEDKGRQLERKKDEQKKNKGMEKGFIEGYVFSGETGEVWRKLVRCWSLQDDDDFLLSRSPIFKTLFLQVVIIFFCFLLLLLDALSSFASFSRTSQATNYLSLTFLSFFPCFPYLPVAEIDRISVQERE